MTTAVAAVAPVLTLASWIVYMAAIARERVPPRPWGHIAVHVAAIAAVMTSLWLGRVDGLALALTAAAVVLPLSGLFLFLLTQAPTPDTPIAIGLGDAMIPVTARTAEGTPWSSDALRGRRVLFKFYRGGW